MPKPPLLTDVPLIVTTRGGKPAIELRKILTDPQAIRAAISCAYHNTPIIVMPSFTNRIKALGSLQQKGIIEYDTEKKEYSYLI